MTTIVTVDKIGLGTEEDPFRPDTTATWWQLIMDLGDKMVIQILSDDAPADTEPEAKPTK